MIGYTRESMGLNRDTQVKVVITVCQDIADSFDEGFDIGAAIIDFSKAFGLALMIGCL
jgi:hypothetical protein